MALLDSKVTPPTQEVHSIEQTTTVANPFEATITNPQVNKSNAFAAQDYALIINSFEKKTAEVPRKEYVIATHYKDVYSTRNFSERVQEQMQYYPGMHQTNPQSNDPAYTNAVEMGSQRLDYWNTAMDNPDAFMNALRDSGQDFDYTTIFGTDADAKTRAEHIGKMFTQCIPCFDRKLDLGSLIPDGDLLEVHSINIMMRTDLLDQIRDLLGPGNYIDICSLLNMLSRLCPSDLLAMLILLSQYLAKLNLDFTFNIDFIVNLIGPILSPFLNALSAWLDKWIQLILGPMLCVVDHINETIILAQQAKIPFSESRVNIDGSLGAALPGHENFFAGNQTGAANENFVNGAAWSSGEVQRFETPDAEKYNPEPPDFPAEETNLAGAEIREAWAQPENKMSPEERTETDKRWEELRRKNRTEYNTVPAPERYTPNNGSRWSKDNVPNSKKLGYSVGDEYYPPEKYNRVRSGNWYVDVSPITNSIVQMRNVLQGSIQYVQDWFNYINQMIYDLLGTDFGWMSNKTKSSYTKSNLIQLISIIKAILEAHDKNGLECGLDSNFNEDQMRYIFENTMNRYTDTRFAIQDDGNILVIPPGATNIPETSNQSSTTVSDGVEATPTDSAQIDEQVSLGEGIGNVSTSANLPSQQKSVKSGIMVKNCLKDLTAEQLSDARKWIAEYERKSQ